MHYQRPCTTNLSEHISQPRLDAGGSNEEEVLDFVLLHGPLGLNKGQSGGSIQ